MVSSQYSPTSNPTTHHPLAAGLRFKWAAFSAVAIFAAVYWIDAWLFRRGLRRDAMLLDNLILSAVVFALGVLQQLRQERALRRQRHLMGIVADMNHHTRNALQVIVSRSVLSMADVHAIEDIRQAVARIDWCLREILPNADETIARGREAPQDGHSKALAASPKQGGDHV